MQTIAGNQNALCQVPKVAMARPARPPAPAPPTLWATFQMAVLPPRSEVENQCTRVRPDGGQPMPWKKPLTIMTTANSATEAPTAGTNATTRFANADSSRPMGRNQRALLRSLTMALRNLLNPYASSTPLVRIPRPRALKPFSSRRIVATRGTLLRIR
jgi:hypothetical protein